MVAKRRAELISERDRKRRGDVSRFFFLSITL